MGIVRTAFSILVIVISLGNTTTAAQTSAAAAAESGGDSPGRGHWQALPVGLLFPPYIAGEKESRMSWSILHDRDHGGLWDMAVGGRVGLVRRGPAGAHTVQGWQLDLEGAAMPRLDPEITNNLEAVD